MEEGFIRAASWLMGDLSGHTLNCGVRWAREGSITSLPTPVADDDDADVAKG